MANQKRSRVWRWLIIRDSKLGNQFRTQAGSWANNPDYQKIQQFKTEADALKELCAAHAKGDRSAFVAGEYVLPNDETPQPKPFTRQVERVWTIQQVVIDPLTGDRHLWYPSANAKGITGVGLVWTPDPVEAIRFKRQKDAEAMVLMLFNMNERASHHATEIQVSV